MKKNTREIVAERLAALMRSRPDLDTQPKLAKRSKVGQTTIGRLLRAEVDANSDTLKKLATAFGVPVGHLYGEGGEEGEHPHRRVADFELVSADQTDGEVGEIEYWEAKGSCGGGFLNYEQLPKGHLIKEAAFFHKYGVRPGNLFAVYADGNSMADFIVDGDIVIFDKTMTTPVSGKIFLIDHPEGLRIKQLRRGIDGAWILESKNPDKRTYPDERIEPGQEELLQIHGQFIYRQGG